ncbi:MAG TPA: LacI family DNA-binding transcriptional regulator [Acidimicrobiia bacterium]|jgi:alanine racemase|nr:LacI family DNA-binding transcriptional regulator [Acidimicrobiia bacterium]
MRPKLSDVAIIAGVSEATVSRVINGKPGVAESTRRQVLDALSDLGYRDVPSRPHRSGLVGILTPELVNPIFPLLAQSIEAKLARHDYVAVVCPTTAETINEQDYLDQLLSMNAEGAIVINGRYAGVGIGYAPYEELVSRGRRVVLVNAVSPPCPVPSVTVDVAAGASAAVEHLASLGHTRIGCLVGPRRYVTARDFAAGWRSSMNAHGLEAGNDLLSETLFTIEGGQAGTAKLLEANVSGIVAASDMMAIGAVRAVRNWGAEVPDDVSVVGYDGTNLATVTDPALTTARQPVDQVASAAVALFVATPSLGGSIAPQVFAPELVVGASTAAVAVGV